jgi:hypothetical protein
MIPSVPSPAVMWYTRVIHVATQPSVETAPEADEERPVIHSRSEEVRRRMEAQLERLRLKDKLSRRLSSEVRL